MASEEIRQDFRETNHLSKCGDPRSSSSEVLADKPKTYFQLRTLHPYFMKTQSVSYCSKENNDSIIEG